MNIEVPPTKQDLIVKYIKRKSPAERSFVEQVLLDTLEDVALLRRSLEDKLEGTK